MWSKKYCDANQNTPLKDVIGNFLEYIQFHKIPTNVLMKEVHPLDLVPSEIIMNALAYQVRVALKMKCSIHYRRFYFHCLFLSVSVCLSFSLSSLSRT